MLRVVRQRPLLVAVALAVLHIALALLTFEPRPHTGGDNAAYITLGQSLLHTGTYTELWDPAAPPHTKYPPVFPLLLAGAMALGLGPWVQLKLVVLALSATAVAFSFLWIRARRQAVLALGVGIILGVAPGILREGRWILSDVPFWAFTMIALWALERLRPDDWKRFAIAAAATLLAYFTRSAGLPLVLAALGWLAWRRHWKQCAALAIIIGIPALLWWLRTSAYGPSGYVSEFWLINPYQPALGSIGASDLLARVAENIWKYVSIHMPVLLTGSTRLVSVGVSVVTFLLALSGWLRSLRRMRVAELFLPLYAGLLFIWPAVWSGERFLLPALPLLLYYAGSALGALVRRVAPPHDFIAGTAAAALILVLTLPGLAVGVQVGRYCTGQYLAGDRYPCLGDVAWSDYFSMAEIAGRALPDDAVVLSRKPRLNYVLGGNTGSIYPLSPEPADFSATVDSARARYVIFDRLDAVSEFYLRPVILRKPTAFCIMRVAPASGTILFGILPGHALVEDRGQAGINAAAETSFAVCDASYWRDAEAQATFGGS